MGDLSVMTLLCVLWQSTVSLGVVITTAGFTGTVTVNVPPTQILPVVGVTS